MDADPVHPIVKAHNPQGCCWRGHKQVERTAGMHVQHGDRVTKPHWLRV